METENTKEKVLERYRASLTRKRERVAKLEKRMKADYEKQTGKKANYFFSL